MDIDLLSASTPDSARRLLGCRLVRRMPDGSERSSRITETEAYEGTEDKACHAHAGRTRRSEVLFGPPGILYVYLCYGIHWLLNITTREEGLPAAVLIRGVESVSGPGRLTRALNIDGALHRKPLGKDTGLWIEAEEAVPKRDIQSTPRIGIDYAGPEWSQKPWRFVWTP